MYPIIASDQDSVVLTLNGTARHFKQESITSFLKKETIEEITEEEKLSIYNNAIFFKEVGVSKLSNSGTVLKRNNYKKSSQEWEFRVNVALENGLKGSSIHKRFGLGTQKWNKIKEGDEVQYELTFSFHKGKKYNNLKLLKLKSHD